MPSNEVVLQASNICKEFPGVLANDDVNLTLHKGEILALLGENGAGKSTLMNIIYGLYHADTGSIKLKGREVYFVSPREAIHSGIGMVHQHFQLIPVMTVADNVVLGEEVTRGPFLDRAEAARRVSELSQQYNLSVDPHALIEELPVGIQQRVEIIKALYRDAEVLILDEPTAVLTPQEVQELFKIMRDLADRGVSIIFITHKLKEVLAISHRIVVMRDGRVVGEARPEESTPESLAAMMVGREVLLRVHKDEAHPQGVVLDVQGLKVRDDRGHEAVDDVAFQVRAGEVLGIAGVQGNGQSELVEALTGLRRIEAGHIRIDGEDLANAVPRAFTLAGTGHVPEDRHRFGMVDGYSVAENLVLNNYFKPPYAAAPSWRTLPLAGLLLGVLALGIFAVLAAIWSFLWDGVLWPLILSLAGVDPANVEELIREPEMVVPNLLQLATLVLAVVGLGYLSLRLAMLIIGLVRSRLQNGTQRSARGGIVLDHDAIDDHAETLVEQYDIRTPSVETDGESLSGGNQQKLVVAREFGRKPKLLIASQPTRGIDVGSIEFIHQQIVAQRDSGTAVLLVSAELDEVTALSDRIAVMYKGQIVAIVDADKVTREQLGLMMAGAQAADVLGRSAAEAA